MEWGKYGWTCPKCQQPHRVRGSGTKLRRCKCGFKVMITSGYEQAYYYRPIIMKVEIK